MSHAEDAINKNSDREAAKFAKIAGKKVLKNIKSPSERKN